MIGWLPSLVETHSPYTLSNPPRLSVVMGSYPNRPAGAMNKTLVPPQDSSARQWYLVDAENQIQSYELECNAMPVPVALINWWGGLEGALLQAGTLKDELIAAWDQEISAGGEWP